MRQSHWFPLLALLATIVTFVFFYVLFPDRTEDIWFIFSLSVLSLSIGLLVYSPRMAFSNTTETRQFGTLGIHVSSFIIVFVVAAIAFACMLLGFSRLSIALCACALGLSLMFFIIGHMAGKHLDEVHAQRDIHSPHIAWKDTISGLIPIVRDVHTKIALKQLADSCTYLGRNTEVECPVDSVINATIDLLTAACAKQVNDNILSQVDKLHTLFSQREVLVKSARRKV